VGFHGVGTDNIVSAFPVHAIGLVLGYTQTQRPAKWTYFYLYVILDIFSRYVVGWMVAHCEQQALATHLIEQSCIKQAIVPEQLTIHAARGASMKSKVFVLALLTKTLRFP